MSNKKKPHNFDHEFLCKILDYSPGTGIFVRKVQMASGALVNDQAGSLRSTGYLAFRICGRLYQAHNLAWFYHYGEWPTQTIDHINGNRTDNRICNLRQCSPHLNAMNSLVKKNNTSGFKGVSRNASNKWRARIALHGREKHLGTFETKEEAMQAYRLAFNKATEGFELRKGVLAKVETVTDLLFVKGEIEHGVTMDEVRNPERVHDR